MTRPRLCLVNDTSGEDHTGCNLVIGAFKAAAQTYGMEITQTLTRRDITEHGTFPADVDLVVINGEGNLHHSGSHAQFFPLLLAELKHPAILMNSIWQEAGFMDEKAWQNFAAKIYLATFRERRSLADFSYHAHGTPGETVPRLPWPDMSFWWAVDVAQMQPSAPKKYPTGYSDVLPSNAHTRYEGMAEKGEALYVPMRPAESLQTVVGKLKQCGRYATARFHGACLALMCGLDVEAWPTPSKTHKIDALMEDMGMSDPQSFALRCRMELHWAWLHTIYPLARLAQAGRLK